METMPEYRIKKGGREFSASRVETLKELLRRGLLRPTDPVSVDGGDFVSLSDLAELQPLISQLSARVDDAASELPIPAGIAESEDDPWRHWANFESNEGETGEGGDDSEDDVLASFLGEVELSESGTYPVLRRSHPKVAAVTRRSAPKIKTVQPRGDRRAAAKEPQEQRSEEQQPIEAPESEADVEQPVAPARIEPVAVDSADLEPIPAPPPSEPAPAAQEEQAEVPSGPSQAPRDEAELTQEMLDNPDLPVSFRDWLEQTESGAASGERLQRFGRYDDGIVRGGGSNRLGFNFFGVLLIVLIGASMIASYYLYVRTSATSAFPMESELEARMPFAVGLRKPSAQLALIDTPVGSAALQLPAEILARRAREKAVRQKVRSSIIDFTTVETLEDALFRELTNAGAKPTAVTVESLGHKGTADKYNRRPTKANLTISLSKISAEGDRGYEVLEERLIHAWLLVGKYATLGRVQFEDVQLIIAPPLAWSQRYQGRRLALLWEQQIDAAALFPDD
jgi:hypothetical protein